MFDATRLATFALASFLMIIVPGPSVLFVISRALAYGRKAVFFTVLGGATGAYVLVLAVGLGIGAIVERSTLAFTALKLVGAGYLVYLGVRSFLKRRDLTLVAEEAPSYRGPLTTFWQAFVVGVSNPKGLVFFGAVLPQFVDRSVGHVPVQLLTLGLVFVLVALVCDSVWGLAAGTARAWFARSPRRLSLVGGAGGLTMIALGVGVAVTGRKD